MAFLRRHESIAAVRPAIHQRPDCRRDEHRLRHVPSAQSFTRPHQPVGHRFVCVARFQYHKSESGCHRRLTPFPQAGRHGVGGARACRFFEGWRDLLRWRKVRGSAGGELRLLCRLQQFALQQHGYERQCVHGRLSLRCGNPGWHSRRAAGGVHVRFLYGTDRHPECRCHQLHHAHQRRRFVRRAGSRWQQGLGAQCQPFLPQSFPLRVHLRRQRFGRNSGEHSYGYAGNTSQLCR